MKINAPTGPGRYRVPLDEHIRAVEDEETLFASILIHSYALAESAARERLGDDARLTFGIEKWGIQLLATGNQTWDDVTGGESGAVEVAVVRNAFAHGSRVIDGTAEARLRRVGVTHRKVGDSVQLSYDELRLFRERLRSLLNAGGLQYRRPSE